MSDRDSASDRDSDRSPSPTDIEPIGALIVVAFTGAVIGLVGAGVSLFAGDLGFALIVLGVIVALSSPIAYVRFRDIRGK